MVARIPAGSRSPASTRWAAGQRGGSFLFSRTHLDHRPCGLDVAEIFALDEHSDEAYWRSAQAIKDFLFCLADAEPSRLLLARLASGHPEWPVRIAAVEALAALAPNSEFTAKVIGAATHDDVDWVAFTAIKLAGKHRYGETARDLIKISGWPSNFTKPSCARKPVGVGAAITKNALLSIFGSDDPVSLRRAEDEHFKGLIDAVAAAKRSYREGPDIVVIPAGPFNAGIPAADVGPFRMEARDNPQRVVDVPAFAIDRCAVTNQRYNEFLAEVGCEPSEWDHPDQPVPIDRRPSHRHDPRFNSPALPVTGIDWYDAYAFTQWAGGRLPREDEWEKAARGTDGRLYPWGDTWDSANANYVETAFGATVHDLAELEALLRAVDRTHTPSKPVLPADGLPAGASPYGLVQMAGNVWEMTLTNYFTRADMDPFFKHRQAAEFMNRREAFHVLRGGTWTSPPICLTTPFRGRDLLTDRHNEVGFRCAYDVPV